LHKYRFYPKTASRYNSVNIMTRLLA
jgi:hypothetical protein